MLPQALNTWSDNHSLRALLVHGHDMVGNLLLGHIARDTFITMAEPTALSMANKPVAYASLAIVAAQGESPGSSAGGEQPKFTAYAQTDAGPAHVLVKFSEFPESLVSQRWRDLLMAEHLALYTLRQAGLSAAMSEVVDCQGQRFLEVVRFDRDGAMGRKSVVSLRALDAEFVGDTHQPWPFVVKQLAVLGVVTPQAADTSELLWAFGAMIGNSDMHAGNLSFMSETGRPFSLAPAYDMTPMAFAPNSGGKLNNTLPSLALHASVRNDHWRQALAMAKSYLAVLQSCDQFSADFDVCLAALEAQLSSAGQQISRLG